LGQWSTTRLIGSLQDPRPERPPKALEAI
jgi:hypothetical protein